MLSGYVPGTNDVSALLERVQETSILVVGDVMLDEHIWADVERISPEAPVPVARVQRVTRVGGGAANVAANVRGLGAMARLVGVAGTDEQGRQLVDLLKAADIDVSGMVLSAERPTTVKTRIIARTQHVIRVDREETTPISPELEELLRKAVVERLPDSGGLLISDYAKGLLTPRLCQDMIREARRLDKQVIVDPKGVYYLKYDGATVLTPNEKEAEIASGIPIHDEATLQQAADRILHMCNARWLVVTRGAKGMTIFSKEYRRHIPAVPVEVFDVAGAGDTAVAAIATLLSSGVDIETAAYIANVASSVVIQKPGVSSVKACDLLAQFRLGTRDGEQNKLKTLEDMETIVRALKTEGKRIVFTNGCFDLLHIGHARLLRESRKQGDILIVGVNSDASVRRLKGEGRPITRDGERAELLAALSAVDYIVVFEQDTPAEIVRRLQPDVHVKGGDYSADLLPEARIVEGYGGSVVLVPYLDGYSTSEIISRIKRG